MRTCDSAIRSWGKIEGRAGWEGKEGQHPGTQAPEGSGGDGGVEDEE